MGICLAFDVYFWYSESKQEGEKIVGTELKFENAGKRRVPYTGIVSSVVYVTSPVQLPKTDAFAKYDAAFFQDRALILVMDTVGSGSVQVRIGRITVSGGIAYVTLARELPGQVGTADMATWQLWAEVEKDLRLQWKVANPANRRREGNRVSV